MGITLGGGISRGQHAAFLHFGNNINLVFPTSLIKPGFDYSAIISGAWGDEDTPLQYCGYAFRHVAGIINNEIAYAFAVPVGVYTVRVLGYKTDSSGITKVRLDGALLGSFDWYSAATVKNTYHTIINVAISAGAHVLNLLTDTKNAGSPLYRTYITLIEFIRTG